MRKQTTCLLAGLAIALAASVSHAGLVDTFSGDSLHGDWAIATGGTTYGGWTYGVSGGKLNITDLVDTSSSSGYAFAELTRDLTPVSGTFEASMTFDWDSADANTVMQRLHLCLYADNGTLIAGVAYKDGWGADRGGIYAVVEGDGAYDSGSNTLAHSGAIEVFMTRDDGDLITIEWGDGNTVFTGTNAADVAAIGIMVETYRWGSPYFGEFNVDAAAISTPEPATVGILSLGGLFLAAARRRRRRRH